MAEGLNTIEADSEISEFFLLEIAEKLITQYKRPNIQKGGDNKRSPAAISILISGKDLNLIPSLIRKGLLKPEGETLTHKTNRILSNQELLLAVYMYEVGTKTYCLGDKPPKLSEIMSYKNELQHLVDGLNKIIERVKAQENPIEQ